MSYKFLNDNYNVIDINFDGKADYFSRWVIYSQGDKYITNKRSKAYFKKSISYRDFEFPSSKKTCTIKDINAYLTTNGKSYFYSNQCNMTKLIQNK